MSENTVASFSFGEDSSDPASILGADFLETFNQPVCQFYQSAIDQQPRRVLPGSCGFDSSAVEMIPYEKAYGSHLNTSHGFFYGKLVFTRDRKKIQFGPNFNDVLKGIEYGVENNFLRDDLDLKSLVPESAIIRANESGYPTGEYAVAEFTYSNGSSARARTITFILCLKTGYRTWSHSEMCKRKKIRLSSIKTMQLLENRIRACEMGLPPSWQVKIVSQTAHRVELSYFTPTGEEFNPPGYGNTAKEAYRVCGIIQTDLLREAAQNYIDVTGVTVTQFVDDLNSIVGEYEEEYVDNMTGFINGGVGLGYEATKALLTYLAQKVTSDPSITTFRPDLAAQLYALFNRLFVGDRIAGILGAGLCGVRVEGSKVVYGTDDSNPDETHELAENTIVAVKAQALVYNTQERVVTGDTQSQDAGLMLLHYCGCVNNDWSQYVKFTAPSKEDEVGPIEYFLAAGEDGDFHVTVSANLFLFTTSGSLASFYEDSDELKQMKEELQCMKSTKAAVGKSTDGPKQKAKCDGSKPKPKRTYTKRGGDSKPKTKRESDDGFVLDLSDVLPQPPIPKSKGKTKSKGQTRKEGASKYEGVTFHKRDNKWYATITVEGKKRHIGSYENEEEAAIDYARALFKYDNPQKSDFVFDLSDVPPQPLIQKSEGRMKEGASKYAGVSFFPTRGTWHAQLTIDGKQRRIGYYENEEDAAFDYARAVFKYGKRSRPVAKPGDGSKKRTHTEVEQGEDSKPKAKRSKTENDDGFVFDLSDVLPQPLIQKSEWQMRQMKEGASKYEGVSFHKAMNKWFAQLTIDGKQRRIGYYENEEDAASDYARAVFKYGKRQKDSVLDLSDVPPQLPIHKSEGQMKEGASKYAGVSFNKASNKWTATIKIDGKQRRIGSYENEEEAAIDYARAAFKYKRPKDFVLDLSDVPSQPLIHKSKRYMTEGASKYAGVYFNKANNKWAASIVIDGKQRRIGYYENEEEAASDYARAAFKYKTAAKKLKTTDDSSLSNAADANMEEEEEAAATLTATATQPKRTYTEVEQGEDSKSKSKRHKAENDDEFELDLSGVPPQLPIPKSKGRMKEGASKSKYEGVSFRKDLGKWQARITIDGKRRNIGCYENEEEAATDYARAVFKYIGQKDFVLDLSGVPPQPLIHKSKGRMKQMKEGASKYAGVFFHKGNNQWTAQLRIKGKQRNIGYYENEEEAATDYARAVFKYKTTAKKLKTTDDSSLSNAADAGPSVPINKTRKKASAEGQPAATTDNSSLSNAANAGMENAENLTSSDVMAAVAALGVTQFTTV